VELKLKYLHKFNSHPSFIYPFRNKFIDTCLDLKSDEGQWGSRSTFVQLIIEYRETPDEMDIYTDLE